MRILIACDEAGWARAAADIVMGTVTGMTRPVLALPTGSTPIPLYRELAGRHRGGASFAHVTTFNLDEYLDLPEGHPESYREFMKANLFGFLDIPEGQWHVPDGRAGDPAAAAKAYDAAVRAAGGLDLAVLGLGRNGHIGFNEPGSPEDSRTHVATLTQDTRRANARFFGSLGKVPRQAITMGLGTILSARRILLLADGADKAGIVRAALRGPVTSGVPASLLQRHPDAWAVLDREAGAGMG